MYSRMAFVKTIQTGQFAIRMRLCKDLILQVQQNNVCCLGSVQPAQKHNKNTFSTSHKSEPKVCLYRNAVAHFTVTELVIRRTPLRDG